MIFFTKLNTVNYKKINLNNRLLIQSLCDTIKRAEYIIYLPLLVKWNTYATIQMPHTLFNTESLRDLELTIKSARCHESSSRAVLQIIQRQVSALGGWCSWSENIRSSTIKRGFLHRRYMSSQWLRRGLQTTLGSTDISCSGSSHYIYGNLSKWNKCK